MKSVAWSKSGSLLSTCSRDKSVWIWEVADDDEFECAAVLNAHTQDVKKVCNYMVLFKPYYIEFYIVQVTWHPYKKMCKEDPADNDWMCICTLTGHTSTVWSISFDGTGNRLASCSDDRTVKIWQCYMPGNEEGIATPDGDMVWKCVCTISGHHTRSIYDISWCPNTGLSKISIVRSFPN